MSTGAEAATGGKTRAYRWLAATRRLTMSTPGSGLERQGRHDTAQGRLRALAATMRPDEPGARGHAERVGGLSGRLALAIGLSPDEAEVVALAGLLHDIGLLGDAPIPDGGSDIRRRHPLIGAHLVAPFDVLALAAPMIRHHHERLDGSGYPDGLRGAAIPVGARIIAVADEYDRLSASADASATVRDVVLVRSFLREVRLTLDGLVVSALVEEILPADRA